MTHYNLKRNNEKLMSLYIDFLPHCEFLSEKIKLLDQIQYLKLKIIKTGQMNLSAAYENVDFRTELIESDFQSVDYKQ